VAGGWLLVAGGWLLGSNCWLRVAQQLATSNQQHLPISHPRNLIPVLSYQKSTTGYNDRNE